MTGGLADAAPGPGFLPAQGRRWWFAIMGRFSQQAGALSQREWGQVMTELLFHEDSYLREFEATVVETTEDGVVLDSTAFYIGGGGQPFDTGVLVSGGQEYPVTRVGRSDGKIVHRIDGPLPDAGAAGHGKDRLGAALPADADAHGPAYPVRGCVAGLRRQGNGRGYAARDGTDGLRAGEHELRSSHGRWRKRPTRKSRLGRPVHVGNLVRAEADQHPDLIRTKGEPAASLGYAEVRTIDISGLDLQADGGTHVANTLEVGRIRVVGHESKGRINKRLRIALEE